MRRVGHGADDAVDGALELPRLDALAKLAEHDDQVLPHGAADAPVHHLDNLLVGLHLGVLCQQRIINANLAEFVLDDRNLFAVRRLHKWWIGWSSCIQNKTAASRRAGSACGESGLV